MLSPDNTLTNLEISQQLATTLAAVEQERQRAEQESQRAERWAERLRALGTDPETGE